MQFFVSLLHTTHLVHHCGKQWMRTKQCVCIAPSFICFFFFFFLLFSSFLSLPFFRFFHIFNRTIGERFCYFWWPNHPSTRLCLLVFAGSRQSPRLTFEIYFWVAFVIFSSLFRPFLLFFFSLRCSASLFLQSTLHCIFFCFHNNVSGFHSFILFSLQSSALIEKKGKSNATNNGER